MEAFKYSEYFLANCYIGDERKPMNEVEETSYIIYKSEEERKKTGILSRVGERIEGITRVYYPLIILKLRKEYSLIFDPVKRSVNTLEYNVLDKESIESIVKELEESSIANFTDNLTKLSNCIEDVLNKKRFIYRKKIELPHLVMDKDFISEVKTIINNTVKYEYPGLTIPIVEQDYGVVINNVNSLLDELAEQIGFITSINTRVKKITDTMINRVEEAYNAKINDLKNQLKTLSEEVNRNINELLNKKKGEVDELNKRYQPLIDDLRKRLQAKQDEYKRLEEEEKKAKSYGQDTRLIKAKKSELKDEIENLEKQISEYESRFKSELNSIIKKYDELVSNEKNKVKLLEDRISSLIQELDKLKKLILNLMDGIQNNLLKLIDEIKGYEKVILDITIPTPINGDGKYYIPVYCATYISKERVRMELFTPQLIYPAGRLRGARSMVIKPIADYLREMEKTIDVLGLKQGMAENNLLKTIPLERLQFGLSILVDKNIIGKDDAKKTIDSIKEQLEIGMK